MARRITAEDAITAFEEFRQANVPYKELKSMLIERGATCSEAAIALSDALHRDLLVVNKHGELSRVH